MGVALGAVAPVAPMKHEGAVEGTVEGLPPRVVGAAAAAAAAAAGGEGGEGGEAGCAGAGLRRN